MKKFAIYLIVIALLILFISTILFLTKTTPISFNRNLDTNIFNHYGSFIGGIVGTFFTLASVLLIIVTIKQQDEMYGKQRIESRFFQLLHIHNRNFELFNSSKIDINLWSNELTHIYNHVKKQSKIVNNAKHNLTYNIFINGVDNSLIYDRLKKDNGDVIAIIYNNLKGEIGQKINQYSFEDKSRFLIHYLNNLLNTIIYIDKQSEIQINKETKFDYFQILKSQLSIAEQAILFFFLNTRSEITKNMVNKYNLFENLKDQEFMIEPMEDSLLC